MEGKPDWLSGFPVQIYCNREGFHGILETRMVAGSCLAWDSHEKRPLSEAQRIAQLKTAGNLTGLNCMAPSCISP